ncbi:MAG TPA: outer membrane beta-barrel protein [Cyclobacteriaceae bacterium]|jgi:hypothetical protein|nr:outer membrane beta-barrel protein [Cyclobacteriaceae bacterium]
MKKLILIAFSILTAFAAHAQQEKGDLAVQFSGNYYAQTVTSGTTDIKTYGGSIYMKLGKFFTKNVEMGVKPNVTFFPDIESKIVDGKIVTKTTLKSNVGFGIYGTYSFLTADAKMMPYAGAEISYVPSGTESTINLGPYAGLKYFITEKINLDGNMSYLINLGSSYETDVSIGGLFTFNIGVGIIIGKIL